MRAILAIAATSVAFVACDLELEGDEEGTTTSDDGCEVVVTKTGVVEQC